MILRDELVGALDPVEILERAFKIKAHPWQLDYMRETRNVTVLKGRQVGASQGAAALAIHTALYQPNSLSVIISWNQTLSKELADRSRDGVKALGIQLARNSASALGFRNGSRILSLPGTPKSARSWSAHLLVLDECAYIDEETIDAALPMVAATGGRVLIQSTPAGETGFYHDTVMDNDPAWGHFNVRSDSVPTVSHEFLALMRRRKHPDWFAREFECQFGRSGQSLFTSELIADAVRK